MRTWMPGELGKEIDRQHEKDVRGCLFVLIMLVIAPAIVIVSLVLAAL